MDGILVDLEDNDDVIRIPLKVPVLPPVTDVLNYHLNKQSEKVRKDAEQIEKQILEDPSTNTAEDDVKLLEDELFDFDFVSPNTSAAEDDEDEVFFGPVKFVETVKSAAIGCGAHSGQLEPLTAAQLSEVVKEAHTIAFHIRHSHKDDMLPSVEEEEVEGRGKLEPANVSPVADPSVGSISPQSVSATSPDSGIFSSSNVKEVVKMPSTDKKPSQMTEVRKNLSNTDSKLKSLSGLKRRPSGRIAAGQAQVPLKRSLKESFNKITKTPSTGARESKSSTSSISSVSGTPSKMKPPSYQQRSIIPPSPGRSMRKSHVSSSESSLNGNSMKASSSLTRSTSLKRPTGIKSTNTAIGNRMNGLAVGRSKPLKNNQPATSHSGPIKALHPSSVTSSTAMCDKGAMNCGDRNRQWSGSSTSSVSSVSSLGSLTTPVKPDRCLQPKKILSSSTCINNTRMQRPASRSNSGSIPPSTPVSASKRRSFLPTPGRQSSDRKTTASRSESSSSVQSTDESFVLRRPPTPSRIVPPKKSTIPSVNPVNSNKENVSVTGSHKPSKLATLLRKPSIKR
ncbi:uncharacterized protein LOC141901931 [Tubulanus polymorphus]|uniref:uncharacterized protein LOC141901931 n=1 Tax=Tubulanus polymorphus TaxID=672921 RepID=UPI003DA23EC7